MSHKVQLMPVAEKALRKLPPNDRRRIVTALALLRATPRPPNCVKLRDRTHRTPGKGKGQEEDIYRIRVGDYRILYTVDDEVLLVLVVRIGHRRDVYE